MASLISPGGRRRIVFTADNFTTSNVVLLVTGFSETYTPHFITLDSGHKVEAGAMYDVTVTSADFTNSGSWLTNVQAMLGQVPDTTNDKVKVHYKNNNTETYVGVTVYDVGRVGASDGGANAIQISFTASEKDAATAKTYSAT